MLSPGVVLSNRYLLNERIAAGGMGEVWRAEDLLLQRGIAVKALLPSLMSDAEFITRFRTEARMMAALRHPGIVQVYDYGENAAVGGSRLDYLVMEFIEGTPLSKRIQAAGKLGIPETMAILAQASEALQVAHEAGIVHRDVKPSNLLVRRGGAVVLVDFGVARSTGVTGITSTNVVLGSAHFMAPEQAEGKPVTPATDVYALGAVAYSCLTGRPPYVGENPLHVLGQLVNGAPPTLPAEIPAPVAAMVLRALDKDPARRYPSAAALAEAARSLRNTSPATRPISGSSAAAAFSAGRAGRPGTPYAAAGNAARPGTPAGPPPIPEPAHATGVAAEDNRRRNTALAVLAASVAVGVAGMAAIFAFRPNPSEAQTPPPGPAGGDAPIVGDGPGDLPGRSHEGKPALPGATVPSRTNGGTSPIHVRTRTSATTAPTSAPTSADAAPTSAPTTTAPPGSTSNPYTAGEVCGKGFQAIDSAPLRASDGTLLGRVHLLFNSTNGRNCTVTLKATGVGVASAASVYLEVQGGTRKSDGGSFKYYAGPVRAAAAGVCVKWGGALDGVVYDSPFEHCD